MLKRKSLLLIAAVIATIALFSVAEVWATGSCNSSCPDIVDPDGKFFECNKYRVEASDPVINNCSDKSGKCTSITYTVIRKEGSRKLDYVAFLHRANIELVSVECTNPECTYTEVTDGAGDYRLFGKFQTAQNTIKVNWGVGPAIGTPGTITVESRGEKLTVSPLDQLYKIKWKFRFCDQVFGALIAADKAPKIQPGQAAASYIGATLIDPYDPEMQYDLCVEVLDAGACIANLYGVSCGDLRPEDEPIGKTSDPIEIPIGEDHIVGFTGSLVNSALCDAGAIELNQGCWAVYVGGRPIAYIPTGCR